MDTSVDRSGGLFRTEFLDKGLLTFAECSRHYAGLNQDQLLDELRLLFSGPLLAVPFALSGTRYMALRDALVLCAADSRDFGDPQRSRLVNICIDVCTYLEGRTPEARRDAYDRALSATLDKVSASCAYPRVGELIALQTRDFEGPYENRFATVPSGSPARDRRVVRIPAPEIVASPVLQVGAA